MNASYKIVLLGAFVLFAAVVGYYIFSGEGKTVDQLALNDEYPDGQPSEQTGEPEPKPRTTLDTTLPPVRNTQLETKPEQVVRPHTPEQTIGLTTDDLPDVPVIGPATNTGTTTDTGPADDPIREAPGTRDDTTDQETDTSTEETAEPGDESRPAPGTGSDDSIEETTEPEPKPIQEPEAEPSPRPVPPTPNSLPRTYTVQEGDTFGSIAVKYYSEERMWYQIAQANPSIDPKRLQIGQVIVLPNRETTVREREEVQPPTTGKDQNYTVRPGDNLSKIAKKFYGDSEQWELIYARNRQLIGPRPDALKVGMELVIPQSYDGAE